MQWVHTLLVWFRNLFSKNTTEQTAKPEPESKPKTYSSLYVATNSLITISTDVFDKYHNYTMMSSPGSEVQVTHVGCMELFQTKVYRFYMMPLDVEMDVGIFLEFHDTLNPKTAHTILYQTVDEVYPQNIDEWDWWINSNDGALHQPIFLFNGETQFERVWSSMISMAETVYPDTSTSETEYTYPISSVLYRRNIAEDGVEPFYEYLLIAVEDEHKVAIYAGMDISRKAIKVS